MRYIVSKNFKKQLLKNLRGGRLSKQRLKERLEKFIEDKTIEELNDHALTGNLVGKRAFSIKGDLRIIYAEVKVEGEIVAHFLGIGTHSQIYRM